MEHHILVELISLLMVACLVALVVEWFRQPYTIALVLVGLFLAVTKLAPHIVITHDVIFTLVLPPLLFHGALHMDLEHLKENWITVAFLAIPGVLCSTFLIGFILHYVWAVDLMIGLLFGALITPTDPLSVLSILKRVGAPERLRVVLEGESLFNDGTGVVVFSVLLGMITGKDHFDVGQSVMKFLIVAGGGTIVGAVFGYCAYRLLRVINNHLIEVTLTVVLAFGTPLVAEAFHLSGMIAVVVAGLIMGNYGRIFSMSDKTRETVETFWEVIEFIVNSLIFLMIGIELQVIHFSTSSVTVLALVAGVLVTLFARAAVIYPMVGLIQRVDKHETPWNWAHVFAWGGLKGAIPIALVVGLPKSFEYRELFLMASFAIVLVSLVFQGLTMKPLVKKLGLSSSE